MDPKITSEMVRTAVTSKDGFAHEIRVHALLNEFGACDLTHGWSYLDPIESKPRQYDLRCGLWNSRGTQCIQMAVECKNLDPVCPLVISGTARTRNESYHHYIVSDAIHAGRGVFVAGPGARGIYSPDRLVGRSIVRLSLKGKILEIAKRDEEADIHKRWSQALASAAEPCRNALTLATAPGQKFRVAVIPAVVVPDGSLWEMFYDKDGSLVSEPAHSDHVTFFVGHEVELVPKNYWMNLSHVDFWTISGLKHFLSDLRSGNPEWDDWFPVLQERYTPSVH